MKKSDMIRKMMKYPMFWVSCLAILAGLIIFSFQIKDMRNRPSVKESIKQEASDIMEGINSQKPSAFTEDEKDLIKGSLTDPSRLQEETEKEADEDRTSSQKGAGHTEDEIYEKNKSK